MNTRRKMLLFGKRAAPGQSLFDAYKIMVEADSGTVVSDPKTLTLFDDSVKNSMRSNLVFHVNSDAGNRGDTNKAYSMDEMENHFVQTTGVNQPPRVATGWSFNGTTQRLEGGNPPSMQTSGDKCTMAWAKSDVIPDANRAIFGAGFAGRAQGLGIFLNATVFRFQGREVDTPVNADLLYTDPSAPSPTDFFHMAGVRRGDISELFLNGVKVAESAPIAIDTTPSDPWRIGCQSSDLFFFEGIIDDCRAYNFAPAPSKILQIYNQTKSKYE